MAADEVEYTQAVKQDDVTNNSGSAVTRAVDEYDFDDDGPTRAMDILDDDGSGLGMSGVTPGKGGQKIKGSDSGLKTIEQADAGICSLPLTGDVGTILEAINGHLQDKNIGFSRPRPSEFVGYLFENTVYAFFQLVVFMRKTEQLPGLKVRKLDGDAYLSANMFFELRKMLVDQDLVDTEKDEWIALDEEVEIEDLGNVSDTEDDGQAGSQPSKYLQIEHDVGVVEEWMQELTSKEIVLDEKLNTALLCSHNSEVKQNAELMMQHSEGKLLEALTQNLSDEKNSLAMVRACCRTLHNIVDLVEDAPATWSEVQVLLDTLMRWNKVKKKFSYKRPVTNSKEIQQLTSETILLLSSKLNVSEVPEGIKTTAGEVDRWLQTNPDCDPEAAGRLQEFIGLVTQ